MEYTQMGTPPTFGQELLRHFADLRDGTHGGAVSREDKEAVYLHTVTLLDPVVRFALEEMNATLLLGSGQIENTGVYRTRDGGLSNDWVLSWPEQRKVGVQPVAVRAYYGRGFHHPHLRGGTVHDWPLNVFTESQAVESLETIRALVAIEIHNVVFLSDWGIIPATVQRIDERLAEVPA